ncbi:MAG: hypothetical protein ACOY4R_14230 [Pseudomonadota bacterium]
MSNYDDGQNAKVSVSMHDTGSIATTDHSAIPPGHTGGLYSGGLGGQGRNAEAIRVTVSDRSANLGNGVAARDASKTSFGQLTKDDVIFVPGYGETTFGAAKLAGIINENATLQTQQQQVPPNDDDGQQDEASRNDKGEPLDDQAEAFLSDAFARGGDSSYDVALDYMEAGVAGDNAIHALASNLGIEPAAVRAQVEHAAAGYQRQVVNNVAEKTGISAELVSQFLIAAREGGDTNLRRYMESTFNTGKTHSGFAKIAVEGLAALDQSPQGKAYILSQSSPDAKLIDNGNEVLITFMDDGTTVRWSDAVRRGWVSL